MKPVLLCLSAILLFIVGCAAEKQFRLPDLTGAEDAREKHDCAAVFPMGIWQFVHSIDFSMRDGSGATVVGVTSLAGNDIECALITVEGLTLFEAAFRHDNSFEVRRAVPPFDGPEFAKGLLRDIRAIFQPPPGSNVMTGQLAGAASVCRYDDVGTGVIDVLLDGDDCWQIKSYSSDLTMDRSIVGRSCRKKGSYLIPDYLELKTYGQTGYTLKMTLISADNFK